MIEELQKHNIQIIKEDDLKHRLNMPIPYKKVERIEKHPCYVYRVAKEGEEPKKYVHGVPYVFDRFEKEPKRKIKQEPKSYYNKILEEIAKMDKIQKE
jgi:hypothetical protein